MSDYVQVDSPEIHVDEARWIAENPERCDCGHLIIFHNGHCCSFCLVGDCRCER